MMRLALALVVMLAAAPVSAQEKLTIADCSAGGCRCMLSDLTMEEAEVVLGTPAPAGTTTLVQYDGSFIWSPLSTRDIDMSVGGDGECPLELFKAMVPEDGQWLGTITDRHISQCPAGLDAALAPVAEAMVLPRDITWGGSFHPDRIRIEGTASAIDWTRIDERHFTGEGPSAGQSGQSSLVKIGVTYDASLVDPRNIRILVKLKVRTQGMSQAVIDAAGLGHCDVRVTVDLKRIGS